MGYIEVKYGRVWYFLDGDEWIMDFKINNVEYHLNSNFQTRKFIIPVVNLSIKQAEKQLKTLMLQYTENVEWDINSHNIIQTKLTRALRKEKLNEM